MAKLKKIYPLASDSGFLLADATASSLIDQIRQGYPWLVAHKFQEELDLNDSEFALFLGVSNRTLTRRRKTGASLDQVASDRLYRIIRITALAKSVFENEERGRRWLRRPQAGLGNRIPLAVLDTEPGFEAVENLLKQIEYGAIS